MSTLRSCPGPTKDTLIDEGIAKDPDRPSSAENWRILLVLFIMFRLTAVVFLRPGGYLMESGTDFPFYREIGEYSLQGYYPFLHYWLEYPPVFPWIVVGVYRLSLLIPTPTDTMFWFQVFLSTFLLITDVGNLALVHSLSKGIWGSARAFRSALIYAGLFMPLFVILNWYDSFPLFFLLLSIWLVIRRRYWLAGMAVGLGFMIKVIPVVVIPAAVRYTKNYHRWQYVLGGTVVVLAIALPFWLYDGQWLVAGFQSIFFRSSWETIWALQEDYFGYGLMPPIARRFVIDGSPWISHPSTLPWPLINVVFLGLCGLVFLKRPAHWSARTMIVAVALTLNLFLLFSKGFSPQFVLYPLALLVVLRPDGLTIFYAIVLTLTNLLEFPIYFLYLPDKHWILWVTVLTRTLVFGLLSMEYITEWFDWCRLRWAGLQRQLAKPTMGLFIVAFVIVTGKLMQMPFMAEQRPAIVAQIEAQRELGQGVIISSREPFYRLKPYVRNQECILAEAYAQNEEMLTRRLQNFSAGKPKVWLVLDQWGDQDTRDWLVKWYDTWGTKQFDRWYGEWRLVGYVRGG